MQAAAARRNGSNDAAADAQLGGDLTLGEPTLSQQAGNFVDDWL
jgi:hypothetical protein